MAVWADGLGRPVIGGNFELDQAVLKGLYLSYIYPASFLLIRSL